MEMAKKEKVKKEKVKQIKEKQEKVKCPCCNKNMKKINVTHYECTNTKCSTGMFISKNQNEGNKKGEQDG